MTGAVGEHDKVLALFSRGKRVQFTTHELSQDPDQILNSRKDPSPKSRKAARSLRDPYRPTRTHDFDNMGEVDESGYGEFPERGLLLGGRSGDGFPEDFPSNFFDDSYMGEDDGSEYDDFRERTLWRDDQSEDSFPVDRHSDDDPSEGWGSEGKRSKHDNQEFDQVNFTRLPCLACLELISDFISLYRTAIIMPHLREVLSTSTRINPKTTQCSRHLIPLVLIRKS